ncbi:hypothetical protein BH23ACT5_BH23ACT5_23580 [soil metagenome]
MLLCITERVTSTVPAANSRTATGNIHGGYAGRTNAFDGGPFRLLRESPNPHMVARRQPLRLNNGDDIPQNLSLQLEANLCFTFPDNGVDGIP